MDRRRNTGPEVSYAPRSRQQKTTKSSATQKEEVIVPVFQNRSLLLSECDDEERSLETSRVAFMKCGMISNANGSAYIEAGKTKIIASVYGPISQARSEGYKEKGSLSVDFKFATFSCRNGRRSFLKVNS